MKQRIGVYNKKIVVAGDTNLAGPNEIHISELNSASSGGSGSGSGSEPTFTYYLLDRYSGENAINMLTRYSTYVRTKDESGKYFIENSTFFKTREYNFSWNYIYGVCIDWDTPTWIEGELISRREHFLRNEGATVEEFNQWLTPVTEEEFYNLEA